MPAAARSSGKCATMQTTLSAWTPLNDPLFNNKVLYSSKTSSPAPKHVTSGPHMGFSQQKIRKSSLVVPDLYSLD